ncbi:MAG TPA: glycosyltransferase family 2 protein [Kofleriaceae bacterium]|nr:glycosyltransferase family 2 protein [Kofleriaceae bacterium]
MVAAYNEEAAIAAVVGDLARAGWNVVVVDDGSHDDTASSASTAGAIVLRHAINRGQGAALQTGIDFALARGAKRLVTFDADGQHDAGDLPALIAALDDADVALGSRFLGSIVGASRRRRAFLRAATTVSNRLAGLPLTDAHCGLRAFRAEVATHLRMTQDRMAHASELLANLRRSGARWVEVPVTVRYTEHSARKGQHGLQAVRVLFDYWFRS